MFKRFIAATEWTAFSDQFAQSLRYLREDGVQECLLIVSFTFQYPSLMDPINLAGMSEIRQIIKKNMEKQKKRLEEFGFDVKTRFFEGITKKDVIRIATQERYDTIVVGAQKHSVWADLFLGGIANEVIYQAEVPVLIMRLEKGTENKAVIKEKQRDALNSHILFPTDFSDGAANAFEYVKRFVAEGAKKVTLIHVQDQYRIEPYMSDKIEEFNTIDTQRMRHMKEILLAIGDVEVDTVLGYGNPSVEILEAIARRNVELVVMGSQGKGFVKELFLGGVSHNIARQAPCSVLLIPIKR